MIEDLLYGALEGDASADTLGHQFLGLNYAGLEVAVLGAVLHSLERAHAAICLILTAVEDDGFTRRLFCTSQERTDHDRVAACSQCLDDISRIAQSAVSDQGHVCTLKHLGNVVDSRELWYAHTGNDTCRTNGAWANTHLDGIGTCIKQHPGSLTSSHIAHDNIYVGECAAGLLNLFDDGARMSMSRIDNNSIYTSLDKCLYAVKSVVGHAYTCGYAQTALGVLASDRLVLGLGDIFVSDESYKFAVFVYYWQFFNLVFLQYMACAHEISLLVSRHKVFTCHHLVDRTVHILFKA